MKVPKLNSRTGCSGCIYMVAGLISAAAVKTFVSEMMHGKLSGGLLIMFGIFTLFAFGLSWIASLVRNTETELTDKDKMDLVKYWKQEQEKGNLTEEQFQIKQQKILAQRFPRTNDRKILNELRRKAAQNSSPEFDYADIPELSEPVDMEQKAELLRFLKGKLDEGVITEEEFNQKKQEILDQIT